jgi:hypothetical protein
MLMTDSRREKKFGRRFEPSNKLDLFHRLFMCEGYTVNSS